MPTPRIEGPYLKHRSDNPDFGQQIKALAKAQGKDVLPDIEPTTTKRPYTPRPKGRHRHERNEKILENQIIQYLRSYGCFCGHVDPQPGRKSWNRGQPDIACFTPRNGFWYIEVKYGTNTLSPYQEAFRIWCMGCNINHMVAKSLADVGRLVQ